MLKYYPIMALVSLIFLSACGGLAGEVQIVATMPSANTVADALPPASPDIANGERIYAQNCTQCHGDNGAGNGPLVESGEVPRMPSFLEGAHVRQQTPLSYFEIITNGNLENLMPPWENSLTEQERWDVALYSYTLNYASDFLDTGNTLLGDSAEAEFSLRSDRDLARQLVNSNENLSLANAEAVIAAQRVQTVSNYGTQAVIELPESVNLTVLADNGTAESALPSELPIILVYGDFTQQADIQQVEGTLSAGTVQFDDIPVDASFDYVVLTNYAGVQFFSDPLAGAALTEDQTIDLSLYESTNQPSDITLSGIDLLIEQLTVPEMGTGLVIRQTNIYDNAGDRVYWVQPEANSGNPPVSVLVELPPGAFVIATDDMSGNRYVVSNEEGVILDTLPVYPGNHVVEFQYFVPYEAGAIIEQPLSIALDGPVTIDLATGALRVPDPAFTEQDIELPNVFRRYQADVTVERREAFAFELTGSIFASDNTQSDPTLITSDILLPLVIVFSVGLVVLIAVLFWVQGRGGSDREINTLLQQLATLEKMHDSGQINHDVYRRQQQELQARLATLRGDNAPETDPTTSTQD